MTRLKEEPLGTERYFSCSATLKMNRRFQVSTTLVLLQTKYSHSINHQ